MERRKSYLEEHDILSYGRGVEKNPSSSKIICGECNKAFARKVWKTQYGPRQIWQCAEKYKIKGVVGCSNRHVNEETLHQAFIMGWDALVSEKEKHKSRLKELKKEDNQLMRFRAGQFLKMLDDIGMVKEVKLDHLLASLESIKGYEDGHLIIKFL